MKVILLTVRVMEGVERIKIPVDDPLESEDTDFVTDAFVAGSIEVVLEMVMDALSAV